MTNVLLLISHLVLTILPLYQSPTTIGQMEDLRDVLIYNNQFVGPLPSEIGNCFQLEKLEIQDNQLTGQLPSSMGRLEKLSVLKLCRNNFVGSVPPEVCNLKEIFDLTFLAADCNVDMAELFRVSAATRVTLRVFGE